MIIYVPYYHAWTEEELQRWFTSYNWHYASRDARSCELLFRAAAAIEGTAENVNDNARPQRLKLERL